MAKREGNGFPSDKDKERERVRDKKYKIFNSSKHKEAAMNIHSQFTAHTHTYIIRTNRRTQSIYHFDGSNSTKPN